MKEYKSEFTQQQHDENSPPGCENHYWFLTKKYILEQQLQTVKPKILDIGCSRGIYVDYLRRRGYDCWGVDLSQVIPLNRVKNYIFTGKDARDLPKRFRDNINTLLLIDIIEHFSDPIDFLHEILCSFPNAMQMIIIVPAESKLWSIRDEFYKHYMRYNPKELRAIIRALDYEILDMRFLFRLIYFPARTYLLLFQRLPLGIKAPQNLIAKILHFVLSKLLILEYHLVPRNLKGTSLVCSVNLSPHA